MAKVFHTPPKSVGRSGASSRFNRCPLKDHVSPEPSRKTPRSKTPRKQVSRLRNVYNGTFENIHTDLIVSATTIAIIATSSDLQSTNPIKVVQMWCLKVYYRLHWIFQYPPSTKQILCIDLLRFLRFSFRGRKCLPTPYLVCGDWNKSPESSWC